MFFTMATWTFSFLSSTTRLSQAQLVASLVLWLSAVGIAYFIYVRQGKTANKDAVLNRCLYKVIMLSIDISTGQRKLEHLSSQLLEATKINDVDAMCQLNEAIWGLKVTIDSYYSSRNDALDLYEKELTK